MEKELFALLRLGLGNTTTKEENLSDFIMMPAAQWNRIGNLARTQGVLGVVLDGIDWLENSGYGATRDLPVSQKLEWIGEVLTIEQANQHQIAVMNEMAEKWSKQGCCVMVMKGQANGTFYPKPEHRNPGDIDCYLFDDYDKGNDIARKADANVDESWYKHSVINYRKETFENHQYFVHTRDGNRGKRLNDELVEGLKAQESSTSEATKPSAWFRDERAKLTEFTYMPPVQWNAMFLTYHACAHFVSEGLRLKQILDWSMFLKTHQDDIDWDAFYGFCERNHLRRFADAMTNIASKYLGVQITNPAIVKESPYAEKILNSALYDEDYVFGSGKGEWYNRYHLVKNMFHYRWKYEEIYQTSVWKQLWWYATGFLFKTE